MQVLHSPLLKNVRSSSSSHGLEGEYGDGERFSSFTSSLIFITGGAVRYDGGGGCWIKNGLDSVCGGGTDTSIGGGQE